MCLLTHLKSESLIQHTNIQTSKAFQLLAQTSTNEMMQWTHRMHEIAIKTKQETLSMHVITIFTLIFLPGTFIAVSFPSPHNHQAPSPHNQLEPFPNADHRHL